MPETRRIGRFPASNPVRLISPAGIFVFSLFFILPAQARAAASLYLSPPAGTFTVGSTFNVSLYVNTGGQAINAVEAFLNFPTDKLQIVSPTAGKSIVQVWVAQPSYSNEDGSLKFQGTIPQPGINTESGLLSTVTFRVKSIGQAVVKILDNSRVLLNDGRGTDVLGQKTDGIYSLTLPPPAGPIVTSRTHPDQGKWYKSNSAILEWAASEDTEGYSYILSDDLAVEPDNVSEGLKTRVAYRDLADGTYYFHIKSLRQGVWGGITTYILNIDSTPPAEFKINFSPAARTSNGRPIIDFATTDKTSGIDRYEMKIIALDPPLAYTGSGQPFFFEVSSPYSREFADGRYEVVVRAYDAAGNYTQSQARLTITKPLFELIVSDGLRIGGGYIVTWPWFVLFLATAIGFLGWLGRTAWKWHKIAEEHLERGPLRHPSIIERLNFLKKKQKEYGSSRGKNGGGRGLLGILLIFALALSFGFLAGGVNHASAASAEGNPQSRETLGVSNVLIEPPVVTLFPKSVSNDEIVYIGGTAGAPQAKVLIYLQNLGTGATQSQTAVTDKEGKWFYSLPKFLDAGDYVVWTQLQAGEELSPPSSRLDLKVARTAVQIGEQRLSFEDLYFTLLLIFVLAFFALLAWTVYHAYHGRRKHMKFDQAVREAEESIRRGFAVLRKDIEDELAVIRKAKLNKGLSAEERLREEKLLRDLEEISQHIGREVWQMEHTP